MLLWHGTKPENVVGILHSGFRIAPSDSSRTGGMFGDGIYFSDIFNKSYNYTNSGYYNRNPYNSNSKEAIKPPKKYMFLSEVALGKPKKLYNSEEVTGIPSSHNHSIFGVGRMGPDPAGNIYLPNGCTVPLGNLIQTAQPNLQQGQYWGLQHNEFVIYDTTQVRIRYLFELR